MLQEHLYIVFQVMCMHKNIVTLLMFNSMCIQPLYSRDHACAFRAKRSSRCFVIMASMAGSERSREDNHILSSSSNTIGEIEGGDQIQRDGDLG